MMTKQQPTYGHVPIMVEEILALLAPRPGRFIDATLGAGGHAEALLQANSLVELLGIDRDEQALKLAERRLQPYSRRVRLLHGTFADLEQLAAEVGWREVDGILLDIGLSSMQIDNPARGFSYRQDGPLDMRMDRRSPITASTIINSADETELARIFYEYGEERRSRQLAKAIVNRRAQTPYERTGELAETIRASLGQSRRSLPPEARIFQALRIAVNGELEQLESALAQAHDLLGEGGRLAVITFHSLEDRIVKQRFRHWAADCICPPGLPICVCGKKSTVRELTRKPTTASEAEIARNRRAASAKLRACEKLTPSGSATRDEE